MVSALSFDHPALLWLLAIVPLVLLAGWRHRTALSDGRMHLAGVLRGAALVLLTLALAGPQWHRPLREVSVVYALDVSGSVSPGFVSSALAWAEEANRRHRPAHVRYLPFADRPVPVGSARDVESITVADGGRATGLQRSDAADGGQPADRIAAAINQGATNIERALDTALAGFAAGHAPRLVLISDGNQTEGDVWRLLPRLKQSGVRVFGIPAAVAGTRDAWVEAVHVTEGVRQQEPAAVTARILSRAPGAARVELRIDDEATSTRDVELVEGANDLAFDASFPLSGTRSLEVRVTAAGDQVPANDRLLQQIRIGPKPKVVYVEGTPASAGYLQAALDRQGIDVTVVDPAALASSPPPYDGHDAVILSDLPAASIGDAAASRLDAFVREGGALLFAAGENAFGDQGFRRGPLESLLPVSFEGPRKKKELDLVLMIDRSHSMSGRRLEFAKTAALSTLDLLDEQHRLAVIAFDARPHELVPLVEVGTKRRAEDQIASMAAGGQTSIFQALVHARGLLKDSTAKTKHVIVLSDGQTMPAGRLEDETPGSSDPGKGREDTMYDRFVAYEPADDGRGNAGFEPIVRRMAAEKITISTVTFGERPNLELMQSLARWGNGRSEIATSETEIPSLFVAEARRLLQESIVEEPFRPIVTTPSEALADIAFDAGPPLKGFAIAKAREFSETLLQAKDQQPLLVRSHHGLGRTVAFLSDVKNRWSADWLAWDGYGRLWAQVLRSSIRRDVGESLALRVRRDGNQALISLTALEPDGRYRNGLLPAVRIKAPAAGATVVTLPQVAPGSYQLRVPLVPASAGAYGFELLESPAGTSDPPGGATATAMAAAVSASLFYPASDEYRSAPINEAMLGALSQQTGGSFMPRTEAIFELDGDTGRASKALWPVLAAVALLAFLIDLAIRRMPVRRRVSPGRSPSRSAAPT